MEARLLCVEKPLLVDPSRETWLITNGSGVPVSQAQVPTAPPSLSAPNPDNVTRPLVHYLTTEIANGMFAVAEHGWSKWFVEKMVEF